MDVFNKVKEPLKKEELFQATESVFGAFKALMDISVSYHDLKSDMEKEGLSIDNVYLANKGFHPFWYIDGFVFMPIPNLDMSIIRYYCNREQLEMKKERLQKYWDNKEYDSFFGYMESQFTFDVFFNHLEDIPEEKQYQVFKHLYTKNEYGFQDIDKDSIEKIFLSNTDTSFREDLPVDEEGYVTIYRGVQDKSASPHDAYSWTLDLETAHYFATRFNSLDCYIYKGKVKVEEVIDYISAIKNGGRGEEEILVLPDTVIDIEDLGYYNFNNELYNELEEFGVVELYHKYSQKHLKASWFDKPDGIHGKRHIKRVLFLSLIMSYIDDLSNEDRQILIYASLYHDIGREHDWEDEEHGYQSVLKMEELKLTTKGLNKEDIHLLKVIMKYHCIRDSVGIDSIRNDEKITNKERALDLFKRFKDCDGLDRVRLGDLDGRYLRTKTAKELILLATQLLRNIE